MFVPRLFWWWRLAWEGVEATQADSLYSYLAETLPKYGFETDRRCATNDKGVLKKKQQNLTYYLTLYIQGGFTSVKASYWSLTSNDLSRRALTFQDGIQ